MCQFNTESTEGLGDEKKKRWKDEEKEAPTMANWKQITLCKFNRNFLFEWRESSSPSRIVSKKLKKAKAETLGCCFLNQKPGVETRTNLTGSVKKRCEGEMRVEQN